MHSRVRIQLLDIAAHAGRIAGWVTLGLIAVLYVLLRSADRGSSLAGWVVAMVVVSVARLALSASWRFGRDDALARGDIDHGLAARWETYHAAIALACGVAWATLVFAVRPDVERTTLLVGFGLTIALMLASTSYASNRLANGLFAAPIVVAQLINMQRLDPRYSAALSAAWLVLVAVLYLMPRLSSIPLRQALRERIDHAHRATERLAIEESVRHAERMQRLVFESAGEGIAIVNDGIIEQANQALSDLVGIPVAHFPGRPLQSIFEDPQGWFEIERRFARLGNTLKLERRLVRSDGRVIWANVTGCLVDAASERIDAAGVVTVSGKRSIWILADLTVQKQKEAENWHHANHDVMTGLPNRRFLQDRLDQALAFARRDGRRVAVLELDLDGFKSVNDTYGHRFGDAVLEEVARRLSTVVRELDTVGRWGGDEFVLVLKEIESREIVEETVKRVIARLSEAIVYRGHDLSIGASIGIALFPDHGDEVETLMLAADLAMYESKSGGGNTWRFASPTAHEPRGKYRPAPTQVPVGG